MPISGTFCIGMARVRHGLKDFKNDPVKHFVIPLMIEFLTQFIMTFWGVMTEEPQRLQQENNRDQNQSVLAREAIQKDYMMSTFVPAFQTGLSVWLCITLYSKISYAPAQFNPAITTTLVVVGTVPPLMFIPNIIVQCSSSLLAAFVSQVIRGAPPPALIIPDDASSWSIFLSEAIMVASITMYAAELTQNPKMNDPLGVLGLGMSVFMCALSGHWTGFACLSTSRVFGPAVLTGGSAWNRHWLLWISDLTGAAAAGVFWLMFLAPPDRSWLGRFVKAKREVNTDDMLMEEKTDDKESE